MRRCEWGPVASPVNCAELADVLGAVEGGAAEWGVDGALAPYETQSRERLTHVG